MDFSWFWNEWFWFPRDRPWGWKDLENKPGSSEYHPQLSDLHWAVPLGMALILVRYLTDKFIVIPIALRLGVSKSKNLEAQPNPVLEDIFRKNKNPDSKTFMALSKQTDMTERAIQIWFRRRKLKNVPPKLQKFRESSWQLLFYTVFFIYGVVILWDKPYTWKTRLCWDEWPFQHVSSDLYWYYLIELAFYWSLIFTLFWDHKRKDFTEMMVHHVATLVLMYFSWTLNFVRIGSLVLVVHDAADTWLSLAKLSSYVRNETLTDTFFGIFLVVWVVSRLIIFPFVVLYCTTFEPYYRIDTTFGGHIFFNVFLYILQILHILWTYMIFRIVINKMIKGRVRDVRSDTEESDDELEEKREINGKCLNDDSKKIINSNTLTLNGVQHEHIKLNNNRNLVTNGMLEHDSS